MDARQHITAADHGFRTLGALTNRDGGNAEDAALFLHGAAVGQDAQRVTLQLGEVEKAKRIVELQLRMMQMDAKFLQAVFRSGMDAYDDGQLERVRHTLESLEDG